MALKKTVDKMCEQHALYLQGQIDMLTEQIHIEVTGEDPNIPQEKPAAGKSKTPTAKREASPRQQNQQKAAGKKSKAKAKKPVKKSKGGDGNEKPPWED